jgi:excisionase family DNA binding protein
MSKAKVLPINLRNHDVAENSLDGDNKPFNILNALLAYSRLLNIDEVSALLDLSKFTIYRMAQKHQIPCLMIGGSRKFDPSTLIVWLTKKEPQLAAAARLLKSIA